MKKTTVFFLSLLFLVVPLIGCQKKEMVFITPTTLQPLITHVKEHLSDPTLHTLDKEEIEFTLGLSPDDYQQAAVFLSTGGATIDEVGIFLVNDSQRQKVIQTVERYLEESKNGKREWLRSYNPTEAQKLENGKVMCYGNCILYGFLSEDSMQALEAYTTDWLTE